MHNLVNIKWCGSENYKTACLIITPPLPPPSYLGLVKIMYLGGCIYFVIRFSLINLVISHPVEETLS